MTDPSSFLAPLSFSQERLYFFDRLAPGSPLYAVSYRLAFDGAVDAAALAAALRGLVRRHEVLRSRFIERDGAFFQEVLPDTDIALPVDDLRDRADAPAAVDAIADSFAAAPYDLAQGPLIRARLLHLGDSASVLLLGLHHIVFDGPSEAVLARDLDRLYRAACARCTPDLAPLPIQYADFAQWQRQRFEAGEFAADLAFWQGALAEAPPLLALPADRARPAVRSYAGRTSEAVLPRAVRGAVQALAERLGTTPFAVFGTVLAVLLGRMSGQPDVCLGFPVAGRTHPDLEELVGFFSNTLVLRPRQDPGAGLRDAVLRTRDVLLDALDHQELPFDKLVEALAPERSLGWHPLFQVCLVVQTADDPWRLGDACGRFAPTDVGISKFDLTFTFEDRADGCALRIESSAELFDAATIERLRRRFEQLCAAACADPERPLGTLPLLTPGEEAWLLSQSRGAAPALPVDGLASRFEAQARRTPARIALRSDRVELSYEALDALATRLARRLAEAGVRTEDRVAIVASRGPLMMVGVLGVLKADAAYVPLDPSYPVERLRYMVEDSGATLVIGDATALGALADWPRPAFAIDEIALPVTTAAEPSPARLDHPDQLAYVMYTSGSTGRPRGVGITHRAVARLVCGAGCLPFEEGLTFAQISNFSFDASTLEFWGALLHGGTLALFEDLAQLEAGRFRDFLTRHRVTSLFATVALLTRWVEARPDAFAGVRHLMYGGDRADAAALAALRAHGFDGALINGYGPTETTTFACTHLASDNDIAAREIPIGRPIAHTCAYVLGPSMELLPPGVAGELCIGGAGVARGYHARPGLTAERFVPDPHAGVPGQRLYRTGDRCLWHRDGTLRYLGRTDDQVKIDGFRIELEEVRLAMLDVAGVREAAVQVRQEAGGTKRVVGYAVGASLRDVDLRQALRRVLPRYMVPAQVHVVPSLPLTANGKIDFRQLEQHATEAAAPIEAPQGPTEIGRRFLAIVAELLGLPRASAVDRFFDIGGTSLVALRLVARVGAELGRHLPLAAVFQASRLGDLATTLESLPRRRLDAPRRRPAAQRERAPLSYAQERLYFLDRLEPGSALYAVPYRFELQGEIDAVALEQAFVGLIERHEALRTRFAEHHGTFVQEVLETIGFRLPVIDLSARDDAALAVDAMAAEFGAAPYDLAAGPLIRARLLRLGPLHHVLLVGLHHIVFDGPSSVVMAGELDALYVAARSGRPPRLPELPVQYADYAQWQRDAHAARRFDTDLAYWKATLAGAPARLELPTDRPRPAMPARRGSSCSIDLPQPLHEGLIALTQALDVTPFVVHAAAVNLLMARCSGQTDVCLGFPVAGRGHPDLEGLIGFFSNTLVLRPCLPADCSLREAIHRMRDCTLGALEHAELPFDQLVEAVAPQRSLGWQPLFQVCVVYQTGEEHWRFGPVRARYTPTDVGISKFDLTFTLEQRGDATSLMAEYATELFVAASVRSMLEGLAELLRACIDDPDRSARDVGRATPSAATSLRPKRRRAAAEPAHDPTIAAA